MRARKPEWETKKHTLDRLRGLLEFKLLTPGEIYAIRRAIRLIRRMRHDR